jgi:hypothetical protein
LVIEPVVVKTVSKCRLSILVASEAVLLVINDSFLQDISMPVSSMATNIYFMFL